MLCRCPNNLQAREQWGNSGGYCGALSVQQGALGVGAYISQVLQYVQVYSICEADPCFCVVLYASMH